MKHIYGSRSFIFGLAIGVCVLLSAGNAAAGDFHAPPWDFYFGNHIDTHQKNALDLDRNGDPKRLAGFFYIKFTGKTDDASGLPIASHPQDESDCDDKKDGCVVGWLMKSVPGEAKFLFHDGVNGTDHPVWMVNRVDIPQRGSYTHFHWITKSSTDPRAESVPQECDKDKAGQLQETAIDQTCPGWFVQLRAVRNFAFDHGGEIIPVRVGIDNATHLNLVTNYEALSDLISPTR